ncbi:carbon-nitrogen hydrolase family protein [Candidatus Nitrosotenuis chungbukensis]|uniref:carbon-nitrogen hydrolase family protein n=1 Tax=Candidatus Nitrosotenuis chungbukensis TaxID=1353246 RepID=UPI0005B2B431|nr:carbon-nitrogen hydrolase family protein [Candidatus Nitrosotenuis chungbukensis]
MIKLGVVQARTYGSNESGIDIISKLVEKLGKQETDIVCLPEQWLKENKIVDCDTEFSRFKKIAKEYSMTVIPGAFYEKRKNGNVISAPIIDSTGEIIGAQEKIHPFDYEKDLVRPGTKAKVFKTACKFGIIICYDMVFSDVAETLVKKGAQVLFSPSRIVKRGIVPWHLYVQVRALENRVPVLAANVQNSRFGGNSIIVSMHEQDRVMIPSTLTLKGESAKSLEFDLSKYEKSRKGRFSDHRKFT